MFQEQENIAIRKNTMLTPQIRINYWWLQADGVQPWHHNLLSLLRHVLIWFMLFEMKISGPMSMDHAILHSQDTLASHSITTSILLSAIWDCTCLRAGDCTRCQQEGARKDGGICLTVWKGEMERYPLNVQIARLALHWCKILAKWPVFIMSAARAMSPSLADSK